MKKWMIGEESPFLFDTKASLLRVMQALTTTNSKYLDHLTGLFKKSNINLCLN